MTSLLILATTLSLAQSVPVKADKDKPLKIGAVAPNANLLSIDGKTTTLKTALGGKPSVVVFYRGGWCPFCTSQLADLGRVQGDLTKLGYQIIGVTPDSPSALRETIAGNKITYRLLSDSKAEAMIRFSVAWKMSDNEVFQTKRMTNLDFEARMGAKHHILPVPSVFLIDKTGQDHFCL